MDPSPDLIDRLTSLRRQGRFLDAWDLMATCKAPEAWECPRQREVGARLLDALGAECRARAIWFQLWHSRATRAIAREHMVWEVLLKRGPLLAWQWLEQYPPFPEEDADRTRDYHGTKAYLLGRLRDFERADESLARLFAEEPESAWGLSIRAQLLSMRDRRDEGLEVAEIACSLGPTMVTAISTRHELLLALGRDEEALHKIQQAAAVLQSAQVLRQMATLQIELGMNHAALATLKLHESALPLMEDSMRGWQASRRCDVASALGDQTEALYQARLAGEHSGFYRKVAAYLEREAAGRETLRRQVLPVGFVAQSHLTCAPATFSAVAAFFGKQVDHLELADEICYDGTPDYRERAWAEAHGWAVKEFRVTVEAAKQLIDRGIPLMVTMVYPASAHAQAVIGYDEFRQVLFVRDPGYRTMTEFLALEALEDQRPYGPRGLAMVPIDQAFKLEGIDLPESDLYDIKHGFDNALFRHDRAAALPLLEIMREKHPEERLRWYMELALAGYDQNMAVRLEGLEALLKQFPGVVNWQLDRLGVIRSLRGREEFIRELRLACADPNAHPLLWRYLGRELHWEARNAKEACR